MSETDEDTTEAKDNENTTEENPENSTDDESESNDVESAAVTSVVILGGIIAGFVSYTYFDSSSWMSIIPAITIAFGLEAIFKVIGIPEDAGRKHVVFVLLMTIAAWFLSFTVFLQ